MKGIFKFLNNIQQKAMQADNIVYREPHIQQREVITVEQIHNEFDTAAEKLLSEAKEYIKAEHAEYAKTASSLGFRQAKGVSDTMRIVEQQERSNHVKNILFELSNKYPNYKVIPESSVFSICQKYGLVMGECDRYIGSIPMKNLKEIAIFDKWKSQIDNEDLRPDYRQIRWLPHSMPYGEALSTYKDRSYCICAPMKDMDLRNSDIVNNKIISSVPDPVVLFPLKEDMYLIVSKWGDEAEDPLLINEKMN